MGRYSGVSASALVQRWGSKHRLLVAFAERAAAGSGRHLNPDRERGSVLDRLVEGLSDGAGAGGAKVAIANHLFLLQLHLADLGSGSPARDQSRATRLAIHRCLEAANRAGELPSNGLEELATTLQLVYNGAIVNWMIDPGAATVGEYVRGRLRAVLQI